MTYLPIRGKISDDNSTNIPLDIGGAFTGAGEDTTNFSVLTVALYAEPQEATGTVSLEQSTDNINWDISRKTVIVDPTNVAPIYDVPAFKYFRVRYENDTVAQTVFRLQTKFTVAGPGIDPVVAAVRPSFGLAGDPASTVTTIQGILDGYPVAIHDNSGSITIDSPQLPNLVSGRLPVDGSGVTQPVSDAGGSITIDSPQLPTLVSGRLPVDGSGVTQPVSGSIAASQGTSPWVIGDGGGSITIDSPQIPALVSGRLPVDGSGIVQPISGTITSVQGTSPWVVSDTTTHSILGTPSQEHITAVSYHSIRLSDGANFYRTTTPSDVQPVSDNGGSITIDSLQLPTLVGGRLPVDGSGVTQPVSLVSVPLPSGAATEATLMAGLPPAIYTYGTRKSIPVTFDQGAMLDAGGRLRVSDSVTVFDSKLISDSQPLVWDDAQTSGSGTSSTYSSNTASVTLAVSNLTAGVRVRQTYRRFPYQPSKGQHIEITGVLGTPVSGITRELGQLVWDGVLFSSRGQTDATYTSIGVYAVIRSGVTGSAVDRVAPQSAWNLDRLNGLGGATNPSGFNVDWSKAQIFIIDYTWLSLGTVLFGLIIDNVTVYVHAFHTANNLSVPWMSTPNLPLCFRIINDGTGPAANLVHICSTVASEGGLIDTGQNFGILRNTSFTTLNTNNTFPLVAYRLRSGYDGATLRCIDCSVICISNSAFAWTIIRNPTVTGTAFSFSAMTNTALDVDITTTNATTLTGGTVLAAGVSQATQEGVLTTNNPTNFSPGISIAGVRDVVVFAIQKLTGTTETFYSACTVREYN